MTARLTRCLTVGTGLVSGGLRCGLCILPRERCERRLVRGARVGALHCGALGAVVVLALKHLAGLARQVRVVARPAGSLPAAGTDRADVVDRVDWPDLRTPDVETGAGP